MQGLSTRVKERAELSGAIIYDLRLLQCYFNLFNLTHMCPSGILVNRRMPLFLAVLCLSVWRGLLAGNAFLYSYNMHNNMPTVCRRTSIVTVRFFITPTTTTDLLFDLPLKSTNFAYRLRRPLSRDEVCRSSAMPKIHESTWSLRCRPRCCLRHLRRNAWLQIRAHNYQCGMEHEILGRGNARQRTAEQQLGVEEL